MLAGGPSATASQLAQVGAGVTAHACRQATMQAVCAGCSHLLLLLLPLCVPCPPPPPPLQGTKEFPQCGFSNNVVQILRALDAPFESVNILENEVLRSGMKEYSQWPT